MPDPDPAPTLHGSTTARRALATASVLLRSLRPPFLLLTPVCIAIGWAAARSAPSPSLAGLILLAGLCAHAAVNVLNEYQDFISGLDQHTVRTPFSGGSGALPAYPAAAPAVAALALCLIAATVLLGMALVFRVGGWLLLPGLAGVVLILSYTRWLNRSALLCLFAPGLGFGPVLVLGSEIAVTGSASLTGLFVSSLPLFLGSALLLLNQLPDLEADARVGRRHLAIRYGPAASAQVYAALILAAIVTLLLGVVIGALPPPSMMALVPFPLAWIAWRGAHRHCNHIGLEAPQALGANVVLSMSAPSLLALSLYLSH